MEALKKLGPRIEGHPFVSDMIKANDRPSKFWLNGKENKIVYETIKKSSGWVKKEVSESELIDRLILPMVDEARRCLAENIVDSREKVDVAMLYGAGFPAFTGGIMRWADQQGINKINDRLEELAEKCGPS